MGRAKDSDLTRRRYNRFSLFYDWFESPMEYLHFSKWREMLFRRIHGKKILEVGVGTGKNLSYYPKDIHVTAIDISTGMLKRARKRHKTLDIDAELLEMNVQSLDFPDDSFDIVLATFVFCSVPEPIKGLRELHRVCKPGGSLLLLEHMYPGNPILRLVFDLLNPLVVRMMGANINRRTIDNIRQSGWQILFDEQLYYDIVRLIEAKH